MRINKKKLRHFFNNTMIDLGHYDWNIEFNGDNYCWIHKKKITINIDLHNPKQSILHEIAHVDTAKYCNCKHNPQFWKRLERLTYRYLKQALEENELKMKDSTIGEGVHCLHYKS